jgi:hypothetical protein
MQPHGETNESSDQKVRNGKTAGRFSFYGGVLQIVSHGCS